MEIVRDARHAPPTPVQVTNRSGRSPFVLVCDHASNFVPEEFGTLGLGASDFTAHIAWDPGALPVAQHLSDVLDAVLVRSCISRLVIDCNRPLDAPDLIAARSETTEIPGNRNLDPLARQRRIDLSHDPYHAAIDNLVEDRLSHGRPCRMIAIHSFTPVYRGVARPWDIGVIHDEDDRLARPLIAALRAIGGLSVGVNQPYSPTDRVYYTLERHARRRGLPCVMIEIRNDRISDAAGQEQWGRMLAEIIAGLDAGAAAVTAAPGKADRPKPLSGGS